MKRRGCGRTSPRKENDEKQSQKKRLKHMCVCFAIVLTFFAGKKVTLDVFISDAVAVVVVVLVLV